MKSKNISLLNADTIELIGEFVEVELGEKVLNVTRLSGGINSEAFKVSTSGNMYFAKKYLTRAGDSRPRMTTEFSGLSFLWANGIRNIPEPLATWDEAQIAVYQFIKGTKISPVSKNDIDEAVDFASRLHSLTKLSDAQAQPVASEACFSVQEYINCVDGRFARLRRISNGRLSAYLDHEFLPLFNLLKQSTVQKAEEFSIDMNEVMQNNAKTLSPSDFGFHNAIKTQDGRLFFIDFEYYGWDDPVKLIADFYLQPGVPVPSEYREYFSKKVRGNYADDTQLEGRLTLVYPLLGLKWCLIMLNSFLRSDNETNDEIRFASLDQARKKLAEIENEVANNTFPL